MTRKQRRLTLIAAVLTAAAVSAALVLTALQENVTFFFSPSDVAAQGVPEGQRIRLGGLVLTGSVVRGEGRQVRFTVTDGQNSVQVVYAGILPDLFREGQGVVTQGRFDGTRVFQADEVLAKHDETYMPPEVAEALKAQGHWQGTLPPDNVRGNPKNDPLPPGS